MSINISMRSIASFASGVAIALIALLVFQSLRAHAITSDESTFVPITPCRLLDTRSETQVGPRKTPLRENDAHSVQVTGAEGECEIPESATAVAINLTGVSASAPTFVSIFPANVDSSSTSVLNMVPGQGPTPNKIEVELSPDGKVKIYNRFGTVQIVGDVFGFYRGDGLADLEARIVDLEALLDLDARTTELETRLQNVSMATIDGRPTMRISGVNLQIVDGQADRATAGATNGLGNLIVGYSASSSDIRTGSHNLIVGDRHSYTGYGGMVTGYDNTIGSSYASVSGGSFNQATAHAASVLGGANNAVDGDSDYASVSGGVGNTASGVYASVSGGQDNSASGNYSSVSGGQGNTAFGSWSSVTGGETNTANNFWTTVTGGDTNIALGIHENLP